MGSCLCTKERKKRLLVDAFLRYLFASVAVISHYFFASSRYGPFQKNLGGLFCMSKRTYFITLIAVFSAVGIALNLLSSVMPRVDTFGRISLVYAFCFLSGILLGPWIGGGVAIISDLLPALIFPEGPWMPLITLSNGVMAVMAGLFYKFLRGGVAFKLIIIALSAFIVCSLGLTALGEALLYNMGMQAYYPTTTFLMNAVGMDVYVATLVRRATVQWFWVLVNTILAWLVLKSRAFIKFVQGKIKNTVDANKNN